MDKQQTVLEYNALISSEGQVLINRCQRYIEEKSESKSTSDEVRGMVRLLKHLKDIKQEFQVLRDKVSG